MDLFYALGEPTRRSIIEMLAQDGQLPSSSIAKRFRMSAPAISQHLKVLRQAKLVKVHKRAQQRIYELNPGAIDELEAWAKQMSQNFDALEKVLEEEKRKLKEDTQ